MDPMAQHPFGRTRGSLEKYFLSVRGGGGLMVWAGIRKRGKTPLIIVDGNLNSEEYLNMLESVLLPFALEKYPNGYIFQQDNAPSHTALHTQDFFTTEFIDVLPWPPRSPDLSVIETVGVRCHAGCIRGGGSSTQYRTSRMYRFTNGKN